DVEEVRVGAAREADAERLAHERARAVAAAHVRRVVILAAAHADAHAIADRLELDRLARPLDRHAEPREVPDQERLVRVLRIGEEVRDRALALTDVAEADAAAALAGDPQIEAADREPGLGDLAGDAELAVLLERARLDDDRARRQPGRGRLVDDADTDAEA